MPDQGSIEIAFAGLVTGFMGGMFPFLLLYTGGWIPWVLIAGVTALLVIMVRMDTGRSDDPLSRSNRNVRIAVTFGGFGLILAAVLMILVSLVGVPAHFSGQSLVTGLAGILLASQGWRTMRRQRIRETALREDPDV